MDESQVELLHKISSIVSSGATLDQMLARLVAIAVEMTACDACLVYLLEPGTGEMVLRASQLPHTSEIGHLRMKMGEGVTGWVAEHKAVVALASAASSDPRFKYCQDLVEDTYEAFLSVPLVNAGESIGVINIHHREPHAHTPQEVALLTFVGEQMGVTITKSRLAEENVRLVGELEKRKLVERAKGILQRKFNMTEEDAYLKLRNESRRLRRSMRDLAEAIIVSDGLEDGLEPGTQNPPGDQTRSAGHKTK
jgi:uroporphyrinogen-III synthase